MNIEYILLFLPALLASMGLHEIGHLITCKLQGGNGKIKIWWHTYHIGKRKIKLPSMMTTCDCVPNPTMMKLSGGFTSGMLFYILSQLTSNNAFFTMSLLQFCYGWYENEEIDKLPRKKYMRYKNYLYAAILLPAFIYFGVIQ